MASSGTGSRMFNLFQINGNKKVFGHKLELLAGKKAGEGYILGKHQEAPIKGALNTRRKYGRGY